MDKYRLKLAETAAEREQIHALNYATFVEEIPQHAPNPSRRLTMLSVPNMRRAFSPILPGLQKS